MHKIRSTPVGEGTGGLPPQLNLETNERPTWEIDKRLERLLGCPVRVRAEFLIPRGWNAELVKHPISHKNFILPDGTAVEQDPIFVEGVLKEFTRHIAVVFVELDRLPFNGAAEGRMRFRGRPAVILQAPATVQPHHMHLVERLPSDERAYWNHLNSVDPQMNLPLMD